MKQNRIPLVIAISAFLSLSSSAFASGGGVRGGGQIVDVNSNPVLEDLATSAVCDWQNGEDVVQAHPEFETRIINPLKKLDWYFADELLGEAKYLRFCFTGPLYKVSPGDSDSPVLPPPQVGASQIGYRLNDVVYINADLFNDPNMSESTRAYVILHEVIHSFFPMNTPQRQLKLRSMVKAISRVETGDIHTRGDLHFQMKTNDVAFPTTVDLLDSHRVEIEFLLEKTINQEQDLTGLTEIDSILDLPGTVIENLAHWDRDYLESVSPKQILINAYLNRLLDESTDVFTSLLQDPKYTRLDPVFLVLGNIDRFSPEKQALAFSGDLRTEFYQHAFAGIQSPTLSKQNDDRTVLDSQSSETLGVTTGAPTPLLDLPLPSELPVAYRSLANLLIFYASQGKWEIIQSLAGPASPFTDVMALTAIHQTIATTQFTYELEAKFSDRRINLMSQELSRLFIVQLKASLSDDNFNHLTSIILVQNK